MEKYGFVYIWFDRKHKRYYIGCHWGYENDGYICSSRWMRNSHKRRPEDFKRRILKSNIQDRKETLILESKWLQLIKNEELGKKYYNFTKWLNGHWTTDEDKLLTVNEKMKKNHWSKNPEIREQTLIKIKSHERMQEANQKNSIKQKKNWEDPIYREEQTRKFKGIKQKPRSKEHCKKIAENNIRLQAEHKIGMYGKKHSNETKEKMSKNNGMNNPEYVTKVKASKQGIKYLINSNMKKKMAVPGTDKWNNLIQEGFVPFERVK